MMHLTSDYRNCCMNSQGVTPKVGYPVESRVSLEPGKTNILVLWLYLFNVCLLDPTVLPGGSSCHRVLYILDVYCSL